MREIDMFSKLNRILLASGLALAGTALIGPAAFADGGVAGAVSFSYVATGQTYINSISTAAAVGNNGAAAWTFNDGTSTSAGSFGSAGAITITSWDNVNGTISTVADVQGTAITAQPTNVTPSLNVGLVPAEVVVEFQ
jgi:hypothetical protein